MCGPCDGHLDVPALVSSALLSIGADDNYTCHIIYSLFPPPYCALPIFSTFDLRITSIIHVIFPLFHSFPSSFSSFHSSPSPSSCLPLSSTLSFFSCLFFHFPLRSHSLLLSFLSPYIPLLFFLFLSFALVSSSSFLIVLIPFLSPFSPFTSSFSFSPRVPHSSSFLFSSFPLFFLSSAFSCILPILILFFHFSFFCSLPYRLLNVNLHFISRYPSYTPSIHSTIRHTKLWRHVRKTCSRR